MLGPSKTQKKAIFPDIVGGSGRGRGLAEPKGCVTCFV